MDKIKELREYMVMKYGKNYMSAIAKLSVPNPYDERGLIRPENVLTSAEKDALMFCVPETAAFFSNELIDKIEDLEKLKNNLKQNYEIRDFSKDKSNKEIEDSSIKDKFTEITEEYPKFTEIPEEYPKIR